MATLEEITSQLPDNHPARKEHLQLKADIAEAVELIKEAKRKFTPFSMTTFANEFLEKHKPQ